MASAKAKSERAASDFEGLVKNVVYILNYEAGQDTLWDLLAQQTWDCLDSADAPLNDAQSEALLDKPIEFDPTAWPSPNSEADMLTCRNCLRPMVNAWLEADSNIEKWSGVGELTAALKQLNVRLFKAGDGSTGFRLVKPPEYTADTAETWAVEYMFRYITSPLYARIDRCARCSHYFFKQTRRGDYRFCSGACGRSFHAVKQRKAMRDEERQAALKRIRKAIRKFHSLSAKKQAEIAAAKGGVKKWLAESDGVCVKTNFITRAVRLGDLDLSKLGL